MIINLYAKQGQTSLKRHSLKFDLPPIQFNNQFVQINEILIDFGSGSKVKPLLGAIYSTLIDKSSENPKQQLLLFQLKKESNFLLYSPTHLQRYKIQRPSLQTAEFDLELSEKHPIREIIIQLEITNARIQLIHSKALQK